MRRRFSLASLLNRSQTVLLPLLLIVAIGPLGCASLFKTGMPKQVDPAEVQRLKAARQLGSLIETYHAIAGHYPLAGPQWRGVSGVIFIGTTPTTKLSYTGLQEEHVALNAKLFQQEISKVLGRPVTLPLPPQSAPDSGLGHYRYRVFGNDYELTIFTAVDHPFTRATTDARYQLTISSLEQHQGATPYADLMDNNAYIISSTHLVPKVELPAGHTLPEPTPADTLRFAIAKNSPSDIQAAIRGGSSVNPTCSPNDPCNPLVLTARIGNLKLIQLLRASRANPDGADGLGDTALLAAGNNEDKAEARKIRAYLLSIGANPNQPNHWGWTPFTSFAAAGELKLMDQAVAKGANIDLQPATIGLADIPHGDTALVAATRYGQYDAVNWLLKRHANPNLVGYDGQTALQVANASGNQAIIRLISASAGE